MLKNALYKRQAITTCSQMCSACVVYVLKCGEGYHSNILNKDDHKEGAIHKETMSALRVVRSLQDTQAPNISILGQWHSTWLHNRYTQPCLKAI